MKRDDVVIIFGLAVIFTLGIAIGVSIGKHTTQQKAITRGHAIYNPTNGEFQWKEWQQ